MIDGFACFILTHGRPNNVRTYKTLRRHGYTGPIYIICDNEDDTLDQYRAIYGDQVIVFDKAAIAEQFDTGDNSTERRSVVFARNASFQIASDLGLDWFLQLDDDYKEWVYKFNEALSFKERHIHNLDAIFAALVTYYRTIPASTIAMAQTGDYIGGRSNQRARQLRPWRKAMNTFFCSPHRPFDFVGRVNEDVNTYTSAGHRGQLFLTIPLVAINQADTQQNAGGMTDLYLAEGTYVKSFYPVLYGPSFVKIHMMHGHTYSRIHHRVSWDHAVPKILDQRHQR